MLTASFSKANVKKIDETNVSAQFGTTYSCSMPFYLLWVLTAFDSKASIRRIDETNVVAFKDTIQLKCNLIPARELQVDNSRVKITLCVQYMNGHLSHLCVHQVNHCAFAPVNVALI